MTPGQMVSGLFQLLLLFIFGFGITCHVDNFDSTKLVIFGWIWECALNWLTWNRSTNACLTFVTSAIQKLHILYMFFCWSLCANDSQLIWNFAWHSNATYPKHLPLEFLFGHAILGVNPYGRCGVVAHLPQIAKLSNNHKIMVSRFLSWME